MFKRRARFVFIGPAAVVELAVGCAREHVAQWIEADRLERDAPAAAARDPVAWADVCVILDDGPAPAGKPCRRWQVGAPEDPRTHDRLLEALQGAVGGLRMLARSDRGDGRPT